MSKVEKVSIALPGEMLDTVKEAVSSGRYASASEVVREALREWELRKPLREAEIERLRKAWMDGLASGTAEPYEMNEILEDAERRLAEVQAARKRA